MATLGSLHLWFLYVCVFVIASPGWLVSGHVSYRGRPSDGPCDTVCSSSFRGTPPNRCCNRGLDVVAETAAQSGRFPEWVVLGHVSYRGRPSDGSCDSVCWSGFRGTPPSRRCNSGLEVLAETAIQSVRAAEWVVSGHVSCRGRRPDGFCDKECWSGFRGTPPNMCCNSGLEGLADMGVHQTGRAPDGAGLLTQRGRWFRARAGSQTGRAPDGAGL